MVTEKPAPTARGLEEARDCIPFPLGEKWEIDRQAQHWLSQEFRAYLRAYLADDPGLDITTDDHALLLYDLGHWESWSRSYAAGLCADAPPSLVQFLTAWPWEEGNRGHWGSKARALRELQEREAALARLNRRAE